MRVTAVLADDEPLILKGLGKLIAWDEFGIEIVALAYDGKELMRCIEKHRPDIIISDISMPHMTGIDMIKELKRQRLSSKVVFISAYQEFTYARDAVAFGAVDYLVKPIKKHELENVLTKAIAMIRNESEEGRRRDKLQMLERKSKDDEIANWLAQLTEGALSGQSEAYGRISERFQGPWHSVGALAVDPAGNDSERWPNETQKLVEFAIQNILSECLTGYGSGSAFIRNGRHIFLFDHFDREQPFGLASDIHEHIGKFLKLKVSVGLGSPVRELLDLELSCRQANEALEMTYFRGLHKVIVYSPVDRKKDAENEWFTHQSEIVAALTRGSWERALSAMKSLLGVIGSASIGNRQLAVSTCFSSLVHIVQEVKKADVPMSAWGFDIQHLQGRLEKYETYEALCEGVYDMLQELYNRIGDKPENKEHTLLARVVRYIEEHYAEEITLESVAAVAFMNPYYFSSFFKKHMKRNFKQYVTDLRMKQAVELLTRTDMMVYEIAEKVGYNNARHFSDMFKKQTGKLPQEFKHSIRQ
ncbi:response regulator [Paenibacillaceae bacterium WGS1546]|uniref:response regulator n=1 Tax=Cohnella sp. WGS1546 TaxID=3366810 RepID=UPI00372D30AC